MALLRRGKVWHIDIRREGHAPVRQSTRTADKKLAQIKHAEVERALMLGQEVSRGPGRAGPTLAEAFDTALSLHWKGKASATTVLDHRAHIFETIAPATRLGDISIDHVSALVAALEGRGNGPATINKKLHTLHTAMVMARKFKLWSVRPEDMLHMPSFEEPNGRIRTFSDAEEQMIVEWFRAVRPEMVDFTVAMVDTGLRLGELLDREHLEHERQRTPRTVYVWDTKGGKKHERRIPLTARADAALAAWLAQPNPRKNQVEWYWRSMREALGHAGDPEFVIHALRHTCCTRLVLKGMDIRRIQLWMGHKDINTTLRYANVKMDDLAPLAAALEQPLGSPLESVSSVVTSV